jgi:hypothetical protein
LAKINQIHNCIFQKNPFPQWTFGAPWS